MKLVKNPAGTETDLLMSAMTEQTHIAPTSNLGGFMNVSEIN